MRCSALIDRIITEVLWMGAGWKRARIVMAHGGEIPRMEGSRTVRARPYNPPGMPAALAYRINGCTSHSFFEIHPNDRTDAKRAIACEHELEFLSH